MASATKKRYSLLHRPGPLGISRGEDIAAAAAAYLDHFTVNQAFIDGNKRTAFSAAFEFLARNDYLLDADETDAYEITLRTANCQPPNHQDRSRRLDPRPSVPAPD